MARWDEAEVLEHIRRRAVVGETLGAKAMRTADRALLDAARRHFNGGWQAALEAAADKWPQIQRLRQAADAHHVGPLEAVGQGAKLRAARMAAGMSQDDLGRATGDGQAQVSNWERGRVSVPERAWLAVGLSGEPAGDAPALPAAPQGRPPAPDKGRKVQVVLSPRAWELWLTWPSGERSERLSRLLEIEADWRAQTGSSRT